MITVDCERSRKRLVFAKRMIASLRETGLTASSNVIDGFLITASKLDDIESAKIKAPAGLVVACSDRNMLWLSVTDSWTGAFSSAYSNYFTFQDELRFAEINLGQSAWALKNLSRPYFTLERKPVGLGLMDNATNLGPYYSQPSTPVLFPFKSAEAFRLVATDAAFLDFNNNEEPDFPYDSVQSAWFPIGYPGDYLKDVRLEDGDLGKKTLETGLVANSRANMEQVVFSLSSEWQVVVSSYYVDYYENKHIAYSHIKRAINEETNKREVEISHTWFNDLTTVELGMPETLYTLMHDIQRTTLRRHGSFVFKATDGDAVTLSLAGFPLVEDALYSNTINQYFSDNAAQRKWRAFMCYTKGDTKVLINSDQFLSLLNSMALNGGLGTDQYADGEVSPEIERLLLMLHNICPTTYLAVGWGTLGPWGNNRYARVPCDSVTFNGHDDCIYTWTRGLEGSGCVKFDETGIHAATLLVPEEVTNEVSVRPDISYAGSFSVDEVTTHIYFCACVKMIPSSLTNEDTEPASQVKAVYYGSPFTSWIKLPEVPENCILVHVRPIELTLDSVFLLGVIRVTLPDETEVFRAAMLKMTFTDPKPWRLLGQLPFDLSYHNTFAISFYGDAVLTAQQERYPQQPIALPQRSVIPYSGYSAYKL